MESNSFRLNPHFRAFYELAKREVIANQGEDEILWQAAQRPDLITESAFLREAAWVVMCSGFRESIVRKTFDYVSLCFFDWMSAEAIVAHAQCCIGAASHAFGNMRKLNAIAQIAEQIAAVGFNSFMTELNNDPQRSLEALPFIGPVTSKHLLKNLGFDIAKPDRHLSRLAHALGSPSAEQLCTEIAALTADPVKVVDLVLWRYCVLNANHQSRVDGLLTLVRGRLIQLLSSAMGRVTKCQSPYMALA